MTTLATLCKNLSVYYWWKYNDCYHTNYKGTYYSLEARVENQSFYFQEMGFDGDFSIKGRMQSGVTQRRTVRLKAWGPKGELMRSYDRSPDLPCKLYEVVSKKWGSD